METKVLDSKGNVLDIIHDYLNREQMVKDVVELLKGELEGFSDEPLYCFLESEYNDDFLEETALEMVSGWNKDMRKYLHQSDHKIIGNFNNIEYDYCYFRTGEFRYNNDLLNDMIKRLDEGSTDEQSVKDRDFLTSWFWETFGTYGVTYNFGSELSDRLYEIEQEEAICV